MMPTRLPGEVDALVRPFAGVIRRAGERLGALELRLVRHREAAGRHHAIVCGEARAVIRLDDPRVRGLVERRRHHARIELDVAAQVEAIGHMIGVAQQLRLCGVAFAPLPLLLQLGRELVGVFDALHVAARARIAIPVPGAADAAARLQHAHGKSHPAQPVQHVEAGETGADHDDVEVGRARAAFLRCCLRQGRHRSRRAGRGYSGPSCLRAPCW